MHRAPIAPVRLPGHGTRNQPSHFRQARPLNIVEVVAPAIAISVGVVATISGIVHSPAEVATAVLVPMVTVAFLVVGRTRPSARLGAAVLLNVEAILTGAVNPAGMAFAIALPLIAVGLMQPTLRGRSLLLGFLASGLSGVVGVAAAVFVGPASVMFAPASGLMTVIAFASVSVFALTLDWRATRRLHGALDAATAEIAARDAAETELDRTSEILSAIVRSSPVPTQAFASDRTITIWNPASERIFGWTADELVGKHLPIEMIPVEDRETSDARIDRTLSGAIQNGERVRRLTKDGRERWIDIYAAPIQDRQGRPIGIAGQLVDVTERVELDGQLVHAQRMGAIGLLASGIAHDFNNMLAAAGGLAELIAAATTGVVREDATAIVDVVRRGRQLTRQLLDFARDGDAMVQVVDLREIVSDVEPLIRRLIGPGVQVAVTLPSTPMIARLDPGQLEQALINLALNARDAMPGGGDLEIALGQAGGDDPAGAGPWSTIRVRDTGTGIPESVIDSIFEPFFSTKPVGTGTGLGLAMVRGFAANAGGRLSVESSVDVGTIFQLLLPPSPAGEQTDHSRRSARRPRVWPLAGRLGEAAPKGNVPGNRSRMGGTI